MVQNRVNTGERHKKLDSYIDARCAVYSESLRAGMSFKENKTSNA